MEAMEVANKNKMMVDGMVDDFMSTLRKDGFLLPWEVEDKKDCKIIVSKLSNGNVIISIFTKDIDGYTGMFYMYITKDALTITADLSTIDKDLIVVPGISTEAILMMEGLVLSSDVLQDVIQNDDDLKSLVYTFLALVSVVIIPKSVRKQYKGILCIVKFDTYEYTMPTEVLLDIKLKATRNILKLIKSKMLRSKMADK